MEEVQTGSNERDMQPPENNFDKLRLKKRLLICTEAISGGQTVKATLLNIRSKLITN